MNKMNVKLENTKKSLKKSEKSEMKKLRERTKK